jgi:hypothetical protein
MRLIAAGLAQPLICLHERTDLGQAVDVISSYLRAHPEKRHGNAASIAATALKHAFPCSSHQGRLLTPRGRIAANCFAKTFQGRAYLLLRTVITTATTSPAIKAASTI